MHWAPLSSSSSSICMNSYALIHFYTSLPMRQWGSFCAPSVSPGTSTSGAVWIPDCSHLHWLHNILCYLYCPSMLPVLCIPVFLPSALASPPGSGGWPPTLIWESLKICSRFRTSVWSWLEQLADRKMVSTCSTCKVPCDSFVMIWLHTSWFDLILVCSWQSLTHAHICFFTQLKSNLYFIWEDYNTVT